MRCDLECARIDHRDVILVLNIDINMAASIADCLLWRAPEVDCANNISAPGINDSDIWGTVAKDIDTLRCRLEHYPIRITLRANGLDDAKVPGIPHHEGLAAAKSMMRHGIHGDSMDRACSGNDSYRCERIKVVDGDSLPSRDIQQAIVRVGS